MGRRHLGRKRIVEEAYDRLGPRFSAWVEETPFEPRSWFLAEVMARLPSGADVLELGCGPGTSAAALPAGRRYTGVDLSEVQLAIARESAPELEFIRADFTTMELPSASIDAVVSFYVFNHVPRAEVAPTFDRISAWLRPGGLLMLSMGAADTDGAIQEDWLGEVPMYFAGFPPETNERLLREAGFELELSEVRAQDEGAEGIARFHRMIGRTPGEPR